MLTGALVSGSATLVLLQSQPEEPFKLVLLGGGAHVEGQVTPLGD